MTMRCLWLTRVDPRPADNGELIYSERLIGALGAAGVDVTVLCLMHPESTRRDGEHDGGVRWSIVQRAHRPLWHSLMSPLPNIACRCAVPELRSRLVDALSRDRWDAIVVDSLCMGWTVPTVLAAIERRPRRPRLVYVSHNHEESMRASVARKYRGNPLKHAALLMDSRKVAMLERRVAGAADLVAAIAPADAALYRRDRQGRPVLDLPPGYDGRRVPRRHITADMPRRVVMVGSFGWVAKQLNLRQFAEAASPAFDRMGAELTVVGHGGMFIDELRRRFPSIRFTGRVESVYPYLDQARMAVVPERLGGGFKLKALDYVFNRLPIAALDRAFEGMPLVSNDSVLAYGDVDALVRGILDSIDDLPLLNRLQERAFAACDGQFEWAARGRALASAMNAL